MTKVTRGVSAAQWLSGCGSWSGKPGLGSVLMMQLRIGYNVINRVQKFRRNIYVGGFMAGELIIPGHHNPAERFVLAVV